MALLVGALLWFNLQYGGGDVVPTTTGLPGADPAVRPRSTRAATTDTSLRLPHRRAPPVRRPSRRSPPSIPTATAKRTPPTPLARADGNPSTSWTTECYSSQYMGAKQGVGLVVSFDTPMQQALAVDVINAPYQLRFFASDAAVAPTDLDGWGPALGTKAFASEPGDRHVADPAGAGRCTCWCS